MIRTVREELLDQVLFWIELDLEPKLAAFGSITTATVFTAESTAFHRSKTMDKAIIR